MKEVTINIIGDYKTGKTAIASLIEVMLKAFDINVLNKDIDVNTYSDEITDKILETISSKIEVDINVIQVQYKPKPVIRTYLPEEVISMLESIDTNCGDWAYKDIETLINKIHMESKK